MRPEFHFTATSGWINDPHGITYRDGEYHAFFQYVPDRTDWAPNCHWGHARGADLLSLQELPVAIAPGDGDGGIWTGSLVTDDDGWRPDLLYLDIRRRTSASDASGSRRRTTTAGSPGRRAPFVVDAPADLDLIAYRDPFLREDPDGWRMFVGAAGADGTAMALSYRSDDLATWEYEGVALSRSTSETADVWMGALWECPQIFDIDGRAVMVSSVWDDDVLHYAGYAVGTYADGTFTATRWGRLTYGDSYYAPSLFRDADGRPCLSFWMRGIADEVGRLGQRTQRALCAHARRRHPGRDPAPRPRQIPDRHSPPETSPGSPQTSHGPRTTPGCRSNPAARPWSPWSARTTRLTVAVGDKAWTIPYSGDVRIILDGPVLEVASAARPVRQLHRPAGHHPDRAGHQLGDRRSCPQPIATPTRSRTKGRARQSSRLVVCALG